MDVQSSDVVESTAVESKSECNSSWSEFMSEFLGIESESQVLVVQVGVLINQSKR